MEKHTEHFMLVISDSKTPQINRSHAKYLDKYFTI